MFSNRLAGVCLLLALALLSLAVTGERSRASVPTLTLNPSLETVSPNTPFTVAVTVDEATEVAGFEFDLLYDQTLVTLTGMTLDARLGQTGTCDADGQRCVLTLGPKPTVGGASVGAVSYGRGATFAGDGTLALLHFQPTGAGADDMLSLTVKAPLITSRQGQTLTPESGPSPTIAFGDDANSDDNSNDHRIFLPGISSSDSNAAGGE